MARPFVIHANLDAEARWAGGSLPGAIATRVSYYAALLSVLAPPGADIEVWAPAPIDASRLIASPAWRPPSMRAGTPPRADLVWADPDAKAANDRRLALAIARELGVALPGADIVESLDALVAWTSRQGRWVAKAPWTTAGRDRCHGEGAPTGEQRTRLSRLLERYGTLVVEPWVERLFDVGMCGMVDAYRGRARDDADALYVPVQDPHGLIVDARGMFFGIDLASPALTVHERTDLFRTVHEVANRLGSLDFRGAFSVDAFVYRDASGGRRLHPLCEINARTTFGHITHAFAPRGYKRLGFGGAPDGATLLVAPSTDGATAWVA